MTREIGLRDGLVNLQAIADCSCPHHVQEVLSEFINQLAELLIFDIIYLRSYCYLFHFHIFKSTRYAATANDAV